MKILALAALPESVSAALDAIDRDPRLGVVVERRAAAAEMQIDELAEAYDGLLLAAERGTSLVPEIRRRSGIESLLIVTFGGGEHAETESLDGGADLWLDPGVEAAALAARLRALLRRGVLGSPPRLDAPSGLLSPTRFHELLRHEFERSKRYRRAVSALAIAPDLYAPPAIGGSAAEPSLALATRLRRAVRDVDLLTRLTDQRFAMALPETDATGASCTAERLQQTARRVERSIGNEPSRSAPLSIGIAAYPARGIESPDHLLGRAVESMLHARRRGGDRIVVFGTPEIVWSRTPPDPRSP